LDLANDKKGGGMFFRNFSYRGRAVLGWSLMIVVSFCSGLASLVYQLTWQKCLTQEIGVDSVSLSIIVGIFMIGLAFGYYAGGILSRLSVSRLPLYYCITECVIAVFGFVSIPVLRGVHHALGVSSLPVTFFVNFLT
jgi:predicted membrane-bound spermidine synthase